MLTLTRKVGETIQIGPDIQIVVKEIRRNQVRIGITAPRDVQIFRSEVLEDANIDPADLDGTVEVSLDLHGDDDDEVSFPR